MATIVLKRQGDVFSLMGRARLDDGTQADTGFFPISDAPHAVELELEVDFARLGALSLKAGAAGTIYWDEFESRRSS